MTGFLQLLSVMREQMHANMSRSDVLRALILPLSLLIAATIACVVADGPGWLLVLFAALFVVFLALYAYAYLFCLHTDKDALRSEKYTLHKMAIEHGVYGDNRTGVMTIDEAQSSASLPAATGQDKQIPGGSSE